MRRLWLILIVILLLGSPALAQDEPDRVQVYRLIRVTDNETASRMHWIEIWESRDYVNDARQLVMVDVQARGVDQAAEVACYYAMSQGAGAPVIYMKDDELIPVDDAGKFWEEMANRRVSDQSRLYATGVLCEPGAIVSVNGVLAQSCVFENADASTVFFVKPPATARGELWRVTEDVYKEFPVRYYFEAQGSTTRVTHRYEAYIRDFMLTAPEKLDLLCFDGGFPKLDSLTPITGNALTYAAFVSDLSASELQMQLDAALLGPWQSADTERNDARAYTRTLENGTECSLLLTFAPRTGAPGTSLAVDVFPRAVDMANLDLPDVGPAVVQSASQSVTVEGNVNEALAVLLADFGADGWVQRAELTDVREDSAFVTLRRDSYETYIIIEGGDEQSFVRIQTRPATCGPTF
ncbi:MAG: hypothetical protein JXB47_02175 [Anaerolineae bacterium]|nr:hypothetical protein [Anaerolineae bacterium]